MPNGALPCACVVLLLADDAPKNSGADFLLFNFTRFLLLLPPKLATPAPPPTKTIPQGKEWKTPVCTCIVVRCNAYRSTAGAGAAVGAVACTSWLLPELTGRKAAQDIMTRDVPEHDPRPPSRTPPAARALPAGYCWHLQLHKMVPARADTRMACCCRGMSGHC